jgi:hypothetical protein
MTRVKILFNTASAICALIAAALWYKSSVVKVPPIEIKDITGLYPYQIVKTDGDKTWEVLETAEAQTKWNKRAAMAACVAAVFQGVALLIPDSK